MYAAGATCFNKIYNIEIQTDHNKYLAGRTSAY